MKFTAKHDDAMAARFARRWGVTLQACVAETPRARVFRADGPQGPVALKLYKEIGASGEGAATAFLRDLPPQTGVRLYRSNALRTAMLLEWLDGPDLSALIARGDAAQATALLGQVGRAVAGTAFRHGFIYKRLATGLLRDLAQRHGRSTDPRMQDDLRRALALLERLVQTTAREHVLHGDLGFANVILTAEGPRLIDPKGLRADPAFEYAKAVLDQPDDLPPADFAASAAARAAVLEAATGLDAARMTGWAAVTLAHTAGRNGRNLAAYLRSRPRITALLDAATA